MINDTNNEEISDIQKQILLIIETEPKITQEKMASQLNVHKRTIIRHMNTLESYQVIRRVGDNRTGHWEILN
jgi:ATP-dependent DNA helicase RecG